MESLPRRVSSALSCSSGDRRGLTGSWLFVQVTPSVFIVTPPSSPLPLLFPSSWPQSTRQEWSHKEINHGFGIWIEHSQLWLYVYHKGLPWHCFSLWGCINSSHCALANLLVFVKKTGPATFFSRVFGSAFYSIVSTYLAFFSLLHQISKKLTCVAAFLTFVTRGRCKNSLIIKKII